MSEEKEGINVVATQRGFFKHLREIGDHFEIDSTEQFSVNWMSPADRAARVALADVLKGDEPDAPEEVKSDKAPEVLGDLAPEAPKDEPEVLGDLAGPAAPSFLNAK